MSYFFTSPLCSPGNWELDKKLRPSMQPTNRQTHNPESLELYVFFNKLVNNIGKGSNMFIRQLNIEGKSQMTTI